MADTARRDTIREVTSDGWKVAENQELLVSWKPWEGRLLQRKGDSVPLHFEGLTRVRFYTEALDLLILERRFGIMIKSQIPIQQK